ncbi:MAG TPA: CocE/NonD family hydrolase [Acidimicrobiales bacterium]|jgi:hypothetical protein|nr:CocE/NonD family hydrolase [Acidimicrobiales bacterium]
MREQRDLVIPCAGAGLPATLTLPSGELVGLIVTLHPASDGSRDQPLMAHLASVAPSLGVAVLRYDRRSQEEGRGVPFDLQLDDLHHALAIAGSECGGVPVGLWGFSQGAWIAVMAASERAFFGLVLIGFSAVSPAEQMRFGTAEQLRRAGYGEDVEAELGRLRGAWEAFQRGQLARDELQASIDRVAAEPWFELSWVPREAPDQATWRDMDFDATPFMERLACPVLALYGERDEWVPVEECVRRWHALPAAAALVEVGVFADAPHDLASPSDPDLPDPRYERALIDWLMRRAPAALD